MRNKTTNIYTEWLPLIQGMTDDHAGIIFKNILLYQNGNEVSCDNAIWSFIKGKIDEYNEDRRNKSNFRSEAGRLGGLAKASNAKQTLANASKPSIKEKKIKENKINISSEDFELFWKEYPKKESKGSSRKAFASAITKADIQTILTGLKRYNLEIERTHKEKQYIKQPSTWLNQECWLDEYEEQAKKAPDDLVEYIKRKREQERQDEAICQTRL